jgi:hypothetical protein
MAKNMENMENWGLGVSAKNMENFAKPPAVHDDMPKTILFPGTPHSTGDNNETCENMS